MSNIIIGKYGGSSVTSREGIERIRNITLDDERRKIIVVSAPGKRFENDKKVTDLLIKLSDNQDEELIEKIISRYQEIYPNKDNTYFSKLERDLKRRFYENFKLKKEAHKDAIKSFGEETNAKLLAEEFGWQYIDPKDIILVSNNFGNAKIFKESEKMIRGKLSNIKKVAVIPGFYGYTYQGDIATLSRGGSDLTGAYIAASLEAIVYENFTDKNGIFTTDPKIIKPRKPAKINEITFNEMRDLSYSGFSIFHPEAIEPVKRKGIPVHVRDSREYPNEGTYIISERISESEKPIIGIAYQDNFCSFDIESDGLNEVIGVGLNILKIFSDKNISYEFMPSAIDDVSVILKQKYFLENKKDIGKIKEELKEVVGKNANVEFRDNMSVIAIAGRGLRGYVGISGEIDTTLSKSGVNILFKVQGVKERCMIYGIDSKDGKKAMNSLFDKYDYLLDKT